MSKIIRVFILSAVLLLGVTLTGCNKIYTIKLYHEGELYQEFEVNGEAVDLDVLEKEGMMFTGWESEGNYYLSNVLPNKNLELTSTFEDPTEVLETHYVDEENGDKMVSVNNYSGDSSVIVVPQMINEYIVEGIGMMKPDIEGTSKVEEIHVPIDAKINGYAFYNDEVIKRVRFYGEYIYTPELMMSVQEVNDIMDEYNDVCVIQNLSEVDEYNVGAIFNEGCPIMEITSKTESIIVNGFEYYSLYVVADKNILDEPNFNLIGSQFEGAKNLESMHIPDRTNFSSSTFLGCENLKEIIIDEDSTYFTIVDGVLYNKDQSILLFYTPALEQKEFTIPSGVELGMNAFITTTNLETLTIPADFEDETYFMGLQSMKEIKVEEGNEKYSVVDGVLFFEDDTLVKYPAQKSGKNYELPENTTDILSCAFQAVSNLENVTLNEGVKELGSLAFYQAKKIDHIELPASLEYVGTNVFMESSILEITFNRSEIIDGDITLVHTYLRRNSDDLVIYVPDDSYTSYKSSSLGRYHDESVKRESER